MNKLSYIIIIIIIIGGGSFLLYKKASAPTGKSTNQATSSDIKEVTSNQENTMGKFQFPGVLSADKITNKKAIITTSKGVIEFELYGDKAPKSVSNFVYLAENKYYDGLTFHRVEPGFVIQGGDPKGNGTGGPGYEFPDEPVQGDYLAGTVAMANAGPNTNGSQFFICLDDLPTLPKNYNLFGQVTAGMEVVKNIAIGDRMESVVIVDK